MDSESHISLSDMYDPSHIGVITRQAVLSTDCLYQVRSILELNSNQFYTAEFGNVTRWDLSEEHFQRYSSLNDCRKKFRLIKNEISALINLSEIYQEKYSILFYPKGSPGVKPHRDTEHSLNCVVIFVISGNEPFFAAKDPSCIDAIKFPTGPGDAIIMRGPRGHDDTLSRPIHYVAEITESRSVMVCRHVYFRNRKSYRKNNNEK